jgi:hypothetical protein
VFATLDPDLFKSCFLSWVEDARDGDPEIIAIDRGKGRNQLHLVSTWATDQRISVGRRRSKSQTNHGHSSVAEPSRPRGAPVGIDALGTQANIARAIRDGVGDYCLSLKENWVAVLRRADRNPPPHRMPQG